MSLENWETDGDWITDAWFLKPGSFEDEWAAVGLPIEKRKIALDALARIFPPDVCRACRDDLTYSYFPILRLFGGIIWPGSVAHLLDLGLDAIHAKPWEDARLLDRLRRRRSHADAAFEVRVHAGLLRADLGVVRVPEAPPEKRRDFDVTTGVANYEVEVKRVNAPDLAALVEKLSRRFSGVNLIVPGFHLALVGSAALTERALDDVDEVETELDTIVRAYGDAAERVRERPAPGRFAVGEYGEIIVEVRPGHGASTDQILPDLPEKKKADRVLRNIREGLKQLTGTRPGVVVVGTFHSAHPFLVEELVVEAAKRNDNYKRCRMVVLCEAFRDPQPVGSIIGMNPAFHAFSPRGYRRLSKRELGLAAAVASTHAKQAGWLQRAKEGAPALVMDTARPRLTAVSLGSASFSAGQTLRFSTDGSAPVVSGPTEK